MEKLSDPIFDKRISAYNVICQMTLKEYYELVKDAMKRNTLQRSRVPSAKSIYSLLKDDLTLGCVIPPIVLSVFSEFDPNSDVVSYIEQNKESLIILDGLQRTYTIQDIYNEYRNIEDSTVLQSKIRVEIYLGLNREGVLYRMLTLNTGQTKMNLRHQIEMIYRDLMIDQEGRSIKFLKDTDKESKKNVNTFYFNEAVDAYTSFINGDYLQITREKLLDTIESFSELSSLKYKKDAFIELLTVYSKFLEVASSSLDNKLEEIDEYADSKEIKPLFGKDAISIFNKSQSLTGFSAALYRLVKLNCFTDINSLKGEINKINPDDLFSGTLELLNYLNIIRNKSSKIGNSQRCLFYYLFKNLFDNKGDSYLNFRESIKAAIQNYERDF